MPDDRDDALKCLRKAIRAVEASLEGLRRAVEALETGGVTEGPSREDMGLQRQMRDIVGKKKGRQ
jgi:hypothetical protein